MRPSRMRSAGLLAAVAAAAVLAASPARADTVTDWNVNATDALDHHGRARHPPSRRSISRMVHGAVYDAVNSIDRRYEPYLVRVPARSWYSKDAAAATAAYRVLVEHRPRAAGDARRSLRRPRWPPSRTGRPSRAESRSARRPRASMIAARTERRPLRPLPLPGRDGARPAGGPSCRCSSNDPNAWVEDVEPFLGRDPAQFRSHGPYDLGSRRYAREFEEVKLLGSATSSERSADQTDAARFWAEGPMIITRLARAAVGRLQA